MLKRLPNYYFEIPDEVDEDGRFAKFDEKTGRNLDKLHILGQLITLFQNLLCVVLILALGTTQVIRDTGSYLPETADLPNFPFYLRLAHDVTLQNVECYVTNSAVKYSEFVEVSYNLSEACEWVEKDLSKPVLNISTPGYIPKSQLGKQSACRSHDEREFLCEMVKDNCNSGRGQIEGMIDEFLNTQVATTKLQTDEVIQELITEALRAKLNALLKNIQLPYQAVTSWAAINMPYVYSYLQALLNHQQAMKLRFNETEVKFNADVERECQRASNNTCAFENIGNNVCNWECNIPECLNDGSDCFNYWHLRKEGPNVWWDSFERSYRGFAPLQMSYVNDLDPDYDYRTCYSKSSCESLTLFSAPSKPFLDFDADTCGNPKTWFTTLPKIDSDERRNNKIRAAESKYLDVINTMRLDGITIPESRPDSNPPYQTLNINACDPYAKILNAGGARHAPTDIYSAASLKAWRMYYLDIYNAIKTACNGTDDLWADCNLRSMQYLQREGRYHHYIQFMHADFSWFVSTVKENSGSFYDFNLHASLKRVGNVSDIFPKISFERYYNASRVSNCSYLKLTTLKADVILLIFLGLVGGIFSMTSTLGGTLYSVLRKILI